MRLTIGIADLRARAVRLHDGSSRPLTPLQRDLLAFFAARPNRAIDRAELALEVWQQRPVGPRAVDVAVRRLRHRIERDAAQPDHIVTLHGQGYRFVPPAPPAVATSNIESAPDRFVGRVEAVRALSTHLRQRGLITVVGPPGIGKTRLARETARKCAKRFVGGSWGVSLATALDAETVARRVAETLGVVLSEREPEAMGAQVGSAIASRGRTLLLLDNLEQVSAPGIELLGGWVRAAPDASFLVTSRVPLELDGERVMRLPPLDRAEALALFSIRAAAVRPAPSHASTPELLDQLDGLPLAIELAAARVGVLGPRQLLGRMNQRFRVLRGRGGDNTLWASIAHSWDLLGEPEQNALARCAVFRDGFEQDAAIAVIGPDAPERLGTLSRWSLVQPTEHPKLPGRRRFVLLESVRAFAAAKLIGEPLAAAELEHARFYADSGDHNPEAPLGSLVHTQRMVVETSNILAAHRRMVAAGHDELAGRIARQAGRVLSMTGPVRQAANVLEETARLPGISVKTRGTLYADMSRTLGRLGDHVAAMEAAAIASRHADEIDDPALQILVASSRAAIHLERGEPEPAEVLLRRAIAIGERAPSTSLGPALGDLAIVLNQLGRVDEAERAHLEALEAHRAAGDWVGEGVVLGNLGIIAAQDGRSELARERFHAAIGVCQAVGYRRAESIALANLAETELGVGDLDRAQELFEAALVIQKAFGNRRITAMLLGGLASVALRRGETAAAQSRLRKALALQGESANGMERGQLLGTLAIAHLQGGELHVCIDLLEQALRLLEQSMSRRLVSSYQAIAGAVRIAAGDERQGEAYLTASEAWYSRSSLGVGMLLIGWLRRLDLAGIDAVRAPEAELARAVVSALLEIRPPGPELA